MTVVTTTTDAVITIITGGTMAGASITMATIIGGTITTIITAGIITIN